MSRTIPPPPGGIELSSIATKSPAEAGDCLRDVLGVRATEQFIKSATESEELKCRIIAGRRRCSTADLYVRITNPGSIVGAQWHRYSTRDAEQI